MRFPDYDEHAPLGRGRWLQYYCTNRDCVLADGVFIKEHPATMVDPPWLETDTCPACGEPIQDHPHADEEDDEP